MSDFPEQGSDAWRQQRLGRVTASRISDLLARTKSGWSASRANYMAELITERLTQVPAESFTNAAMQWGIDKEPEARSAYEFMTNATVESAGFVPHPSITMAGASPDGYVGTDGLVEIKCPNTATHMETLLGASVPEKYVLQILWQLSCTGRKWCDFVSFDPRMPANMALFVQRVSRDEARIREIESEVAIFLAALDAKLKALNERFGIAEAA